MGFPDFWPPFWIDTSHHGSSYPPTIGYPFITLWLSSESLGLNKWFLPKFKWASTYINQVVLVQFRYLKTQYLKTQKQRKSPQPPENIAFFLRVNINMGHRKHLKGGLHVGTCWIWGLGKDAGELPFWNYPKLVTSSSAHQDARLSMHLNFRKDVVALSSEFSTLCLLEILHIRP